MFRELMGQSPSPTQPNKFEFLRRAADAKTRVERTRAALHGDFTQRLCRNGMSLDGRKRDSAKGGQGRERKGAALTT